MSEDFNYKCTRRSGGRRTSPTREESVLASEENFGAGSGGEWLDGGHDHHYDGSYHVSSPIITLMAGGSDTAGQNGILLQASGADSFAESFVDVHADRRVRITTGGPDIPVYDTNSLEGVRVQVDKRQIIGLYHGLKDGPHSFLALLPEGHGDSIWMSSIEGSIKIDSMTSITLAVAGGTSSIILLPDQIVIKGPMVYIN